METITITLGLMVLLGFVYYLNKKGDNDSEEVPKTGVILHFKDGIKAYRLEVYRNVTIVYLSKPKDPTQDPNKDYFTYHYFWKGEVQFGESTDLEDLRSIAVAEIDNFLN